MDRRLPRSVEKQLLHCSSYRPPGVFGGISVDQARYVGIRGLQIGTLDLGAIWLIRLLRPSGRTTTDSEGGILDVTSCGLGYAKIRVGARPRRESGPFVTALGATHGAGAMANGHGIVVRSGAEGDHETPDLPPQNYQQPVG